jgi:PAS domain-containing protein
MSWPILPAYGSTRNLGARFPNSGPPCRGYPAPDARPEATKQQSLQYLDRTRKGERWETVEIEIVDVEGTIKTLLWNSANIYAPDGQHITATIAQGYDITERKQAEEELRLSEERFKTIFEGSRDAIFITDPDSRFIHVNQAACELTGYSITELLSMRIADLHTAEDLEAFKTYFSKIMAGRDHR